MADIARNMTVARWLRARVETIMDMSDDYIYAVLMGRGVMDDELTVCDITEKQRDLCLADLYYGAAVSSIKTGTQGETDGGWTHYIAIKNVANREGLLRMANDLYAKWGEPLVDNRPRVTLKSLY